MRPNPRRGPAGDQAVGPGRRAGRRWSATAVGEPVTVFASGGSGSGNLDGIRSWAAGVRGTRVFFPYGGVEPWAPGRAPRREADRDAAEARAVADQSGATRAVGMSRGARAVLGVLADDRARFDRVLVVIPPGGTAAGGLPGTVAEGDRERVERWLPPCCLSWPSSSGRVQGSGDQVEAFECCLFGREVPARF